MKRRDFMKMVVGGAAVAVLPGKCKAEQEELVVLKAKDGFQARVFLDGKEVLDATEIEAAAVPNKPVQGSVTYLQRDSKDRPIFLGTGKGLSGQGYAEIRENGEVYWLPLD